jgi:hypothetical protein
MMAKRQIMTTGLAGGLHLAYKAQLPATLTRLNNRLLHHFLQYH